MAVLDTSLAVAPQVARHHHTEWPIDALVEAKGHSRIVVCIPARDEARTIGAIVSCIRTRLLDDAGLVDEIVVVDDGSADGTGMEARRSGAAVVAGPGLGKGEAMAVARGRGDYIVFLDGDVENFAAHYVTGLLGPLLCGSGKVLVKGSYTRPLGDQPTGGGRVTELVAKPMISLLFPELAGVDQPLAGETALRSDVLEKIALADGYGVEMGLLVDVWRCFGIDSIAQVDLGERRHRNRPLSELGPQAREVIEAALQRAALG